MKTPEGPIKRFSSAKPAQKRRTSLAAILTVFFLVCVIPSTSNIGQGVPVSTEPAGLASNPLKIPDWMNEALLFRIVKPAEAREMPFTKSIEINYLAVRIQP